MARTLSTMLALGTQAPEFSLPDPTGKVFSLDNFRDSPALLVMFICNHCPFVKHVSRALGDLVREYQQRDVAVVGIMPNDVAQYPDDAPDKMAAFLWENDVDFPYLHDESQEVARRYHASCTPDFFLFDGARKLVYRGQMDASRPSNGIPVTGEDLRAALDAVLAGNPVSSDQRPSMGCNIKWKAGAEPEYYASALAPPA